jgi:hypothetical protein
MVLLWTRKKPSRRNNAQLFKVRSSTLLPIVQILAAKLKFAGLGGRRCRFSLAAAWAVRPLELVRDRGRIMLLLEDTGSEPLHRLLGPPMEVRSFLRLAIAVATALA